MAGIINNSARQYNINAFVKATNTVIKVRLKPGINFVEDNVWAKVKDDPYVKRLHSENVLDFGLATNKQVDPEEPSTQAQVKASPGKGKTTRKVAVK